MRDRQVTGQTLRSDSTFRLDVQTNKSDTWTRALRGELSWYISTNNDFAIASKSGLCEMQSHVFITLENPVDMYLKGWRSMNCYTIVGANRALGAKEGMIQYARKFPACTECWKEQR